MNLGRTLLLLSALLAGAYSLQAQDLIYRMNPVSIIEGKVVEVGETSVRYTRADTRDDVMFNIPVQYIQKIVFEDGKELVYNDVVDVSGDRKNAFKLSFLSPAYDATTFLYERALKPGQSVEFGVGVIGLGIAEAYDNASGIILKAGYKFMSRPEYYQSRFRYAHILKGSYIKPEITFVSYKYDGDRYYWPGGETGYSTDRERVTLLNLGVVGGKQWVFHNSLLLDLFGGIGFAFGNNDADDGWHYNFAGGTEDFPITFTLGFKVGFLF